MARRRHKLTKQQRTKLRALVAEAGEQKDLRVWKRAKAVLAYDEGVPVSEITQAVELGRRTVYECLQRYRRHGPPGLLEGEHPGRPCRLTQEAMEELCDILDSGPVAYGLETGIWTAPVIAHVIEVEFGVRYHPHHVCKLLHGLGFSVQRPTRHLVRADGKRRQKWVRTTYPAIKRGPARSARP
jgi:transposase